MYEYKKENSVLVKSRGSKYDDYSSIMIKVFNVPFLAGWSDTMDTVKIESVLDSIIHHFGSLSAEIYTEIVRAYKYAIDEAK